MKSIFTSQTRWPVNFLQSGGKTCPSSIISKATKKIVIYLDRDSVQEVLQLFSSISSACVTLGGITMKYFCVVFIILDLTLDRITSRLCNVHGTHHAKAG